MLCDATWFCGVGCLLDCTRKWNWVFRFYCMIRFLFILAFVAFDLFVYSWSSIKLIMCILVGDLFLKMERWCRNMPFCGRARRGSRVRFPRDERCAELPPKFIYGKRRKNRRKPVEKKIPSSGVVFTFEEGINTSHVCLKGQQPIF